MFIEGYIKGTSDRFVTDILALSVHHTGVAELGQTHRQGGAVGFGLLASSHVSARVHTHTHSESLSLTGWQALSLTVHGKIKFVPSSHELNNSLCCMSMSERDRNIELSTEFCCLDAIDVNIRVTEHNSDHLHTAANTYIHHCSFSYNIKNLTCLV